MTRWLDALRVESGDAWFDLRAPGAPSVLPQVVLAPGVRAALRDTPSALAWHDDALSLGLARCSLWEQSMLAVCAPRDAVWSPSLAPCLTPFADGDARRWWTLSPRAFAGRLRLALVDGSLERVALDLDVRTRKVDALDGFIAMLDDLARADLALALHDASPTTMAFDTSTRAPRTALETLALLRALAPEVERAVDAVVRAPEQTVSSATRVAPMHRAHRVRPEEFAARAGQGSAREDAPALSLDTPENRFVGALLDALRTALDEAAAQHPHAARPIAVTLDRARAQLDARGFRAVHGDASDLHRTTAALLRRHGYRELAAIAARLDGPARSLTWRGDARWGLCDAPRLYERWCALTLATALGADAITAARAAAGASELSLCVDGVALALSTQREGRSYGLAYRPDITLRAGDRRLVFDAKYRLDARDLDDRTGDAPREGITKMHAYRDALDGVWGAYVLHPGAVGDARCFEAREGGGVGAIALRPGAANAASQRASLVARVRQFLDAR